MDGNGARGHCLESLEYSIRVIFPSEKSRAAFRGLYYACVSVEYLTNLGVEKT